MRQVNVGMIGYRFMGKAHSHALRSVNFFFDLNFHPVRKVICGRHIEPLRKAGENGKHVFSEKFLAMVRFIPMWCWTDQKIRVDAFCCVVSLILLNLLQREVTKKYRKMSLEKIADELSDIEEILLFYPDTMKPVRKLSKKDDIQEKLYQILNFGEFSPEKIG